MSDSDSYDSYEAIRKRSWRDHNNGIHGNCDYERCEVAREIYTTQERRCDAKALLAELASRKLDARTMLGKAYKRTAADAKACDTELDFVHTISARCRADDLAIPGYREMLEAE